MEAMRARPIPGKDEEPAGGGEAAARATVVHGAPTRCPWCHTDCAPEEPAAVVCQRCLSRHHAACWSEGGRCASCQGTAALGPVAPPRVAAPAEVALLRKGLGRDAVERAARRLGCSEGDAARVLVDAAARELAAAGDVRPLGPARTVITLATILAATIVMIVFINVIFR